MTPPFDALDWRSLSQEALDSGLNNGAAVAGSGNTVEGWEKLSAEMRTAHGTHLDLQYGPRERNRIDFLKGGAECADAAFHPRRLLADALEVCLYAVRGGPDGARHQRRADRLYARARCDP